MAATALSLLAVASSSADLCIRSAPNPNHRRSILFNSEPNHFKRGSLSPNFILKHPRASGASGATDIASDGSSTVTFSNDDGTGATLFVLRARNRIGLLQVITRVFKVLGLTIERATVEFEGDFFVKSFHVTSSDAVAEKVNNDADVGDLLKVVFIPDYNVSVAELVIPGSDLSQHISAAGHEASGTGSMKFLMNGCLLLATEDGSTVEIIKEIGAENMFLFDAKVHEVQQLRDEPALGVCIQFIRVVRMVHDGDFGFNDYFKSLCDSLEEGKDFYLLGADFSSYLEAQAIADREFVNQDKCNLGELSHANAPSDSFTCYGLFVTPSNKDI